MKTSTLFRVVCTFMAMTLAILFLSRCYLIIQYIDRISSVQDITWIIIQGLRVDMVVIGYFYLIPLVISLWLSQGRLSGIIHQLVRLWLIAAFTCIVFLEVVTPEFILEYDIRPNRIFIDYLAYPSEVSKMLWEGYKPALFLSLLTLVICIAIGISLVKKTRLLASRFKIFPKIGLTCLIILIGFSAIRSSLQHRPFNPSMVYFTNDNLLNSFALNSIYSVLYAAYNAESEKQASDLYGKMPEDEIIRHVRAAAADDMRRFVSRSIPTLQYHQATADGKPKNIVIFLQESLGSRYVGGLGGQDLTPNLDRLLNEGWAFNNTYATGTRSVRGIEAVFTGFSPGPSRAVVKLSKSQTNFFSMASLLKKHGYFTQFIYGGESHFDNMKSFFLGNGIDDIRDAQTFSQPKFVGSWGASDEDLYQEAHHQFEKLSKQETPFFSLVFSSSNHSPWEFPLDCGNKIDSPVQTRENAIRYSDCALGKFFEMAKHSRYWADTLFLVIADHDSRAFGTELVPIEHFKIPALILSKDIVPKVDTRLVSQLDFPTTLLSMAGISDYHPMIGYDLTREIPESRQRAMMQFGENFAWMNHQYVTVLRPNLPAKSFTHDGMHLLQETNEGITEDHLKMVQANALWSSLAYEKGYYRLPKASEYISDVKP